MSGLFRDPITAAWLAKIPTSKEEAQASGFDGRTLLADFFEEFACAKAEELFLTLDDFMASGDRTSDDVARHIEAHGTALLEGWGDTMLRAGADTEPWARHAANRAAVAYRTRIETLLATASMRGRA